jgi:POT family proton-dependent oligopeptide transporter
VGGAVALTMGRTARWPALGLGLIGGLAVGYLGYHRVAVGFWGWRMKELLPSQIPAANPFMVMVLIPYTQFGLYPLMKHLGLTPTPLRRMTIGMLLAGSAFAAVAILQTYLDRGIRVHVGWQLIGYALLTVAEVMISITGLEFAYSQAPKRMKSVIMGFWLFNVTLGNVLVAYLAKLPEMPPAMFFWLFAGLMALAAVLFGLRAAFYTYKDYTQ